jgi:hypothetical protein
LQSGYALAHGMGRGDTLIHVLVGVAMAIILDRELEEIVQQPGCPNLYWALTALPRPYFDPRVAINEEGTLLERSWPWLRQLEQGPMTPHQVHGLRQDIDRYFRQLNFVAPTPQEYLAQTLEQMSAYPEARRRLVADGLAAEDVDAMPMLQVVALDAVRAYRRAWDEFVQWTHVPHFDREPGYRAAFERMKKAGGHLWYLVLFPKRSNADMNFLEPPPLEKIYRAADRADRRFAALRCVEAVRLYAAGHDGRLPARLVDVSEVPIPVDPTTGRPFLYEVHGDRTKLSAPLQDGDRTPPAERLSYDISLRR